MFSSILQLYTLLTPEQKRSLLRLQFLVLCMCFAEVASVMAIGPFMALVGDTAKLQYGVLGQLYQWSWAETEVQFIFLVGISALLVIVCAALISMVTLWRLSMYGARVGAELSARLYRHYMYQPWLFHTKNNSSELNNKIAQESQRISGGVIQPIMHMNAKFVLVFVMGLAIILYQPVVAIITLLMFISAYYGLYKIVRAYLVKNGEIVSSQQAIRFKLMAEGFGGIKDVLLLGRQDLFSRRFTHASSKFANAQGVTQVLSHVPRYAMELLAFGGVIFLILYLIVTHNGNLGAILPILSVYALAGFKLLPAFQQVYSSLTVVRGNLAAFENLRFDLFASDSLEKNLLGSERGRSVIVGGDIRLDSVSFSYPDTERNVIDNLSLEISEHAVVGFVGGSGSGKSTLVDLILGLIKPNSGHIYIGEERLTDNSVRAWQDGIGFVAQTIYLADATIGENIAFGLPSEQIDIDRLALSAKLAHLNEFIEKLPDGLDTKVGERGVQLSGGQRQRIGIARALYQDAKVLVLDEATSALDGVTEKLVMNAIDSFSDNRTIIMIAHRLATVRQCDCIYLLEDGRCVDRGTYDELYERNATFRKMSQNA